MSEIVADMLSGLTCQVCGVWMPDVVTEKGPVIEMFNNPPGYPRTCPGCKEDGDE